MDSIETVFLGIIQGLTEFLPISSSGHLVLVQNLLGAKEPKLLLDCALHLGTLMAVCLFFRADLGRMIVETWQFIKHRPDHQSEIGPHAALVLWVLVGCAPTALIGLIFRDPLEKLFGSVSVVGVMLVTTGAIVAITRFLPKRNEGRIKIGLVTALAIGISQGLAIIPGISRSGITIVCGLLLGLDRELAGRFSFLLSIPAIIGALILELDTAAIERVGYIPMLLGTVSSALVGLAALKLLMGMVSKGHLYYFAPYCWAIGLITIIFV